MSRAAGWRAGLGREMLLLLLLLRFYRLRRLIGAEIHAELAQAPVGWALAQPHPGGGRRRPIGQLMGLSQQPVYLLLS